MRGFDCSLKKIKNETCVLPSCEQIYLPPSSMATSGIRSLPPFKSRTIQYFKFKVYKPGVDFTNILPAAFTRADPKNVKNWVFVL